MPTLKIDVSGPADHLLFEGLPHLQPVIDELGDGALLIGGLAATAWIGASEIGLPMRVTRDVDIGIDRRGLHLTAETRKVVPLLREQGFESLGGKRQFRFVKKTPAGEFLVDLLVAPGASREEPPRLEADLQTLSAPGLAYAILRRPVPLSLELACDGETRQFELPIISLDSAFVMKAVLTAERRLQPDRRIADTSDAVMLAAACATDEAHIAPLREHSRRKDVRTAVRWISGSFSNRRTAAARRVERHFELELGQPGGGAWAVSVAERFARLLDG
ncbi:MAG TPA: hypothetical protein VHU14_03285 [Solirubrobacterales bacterium]|jgi:hypothetical protein|nr:hypothetical protein [Solirubrobacterales bacterium]